jgi:hypothetical protein
MEADRISHCANCNKSIRTNLDNPEIMLVCPDCIAMCATKAEVKSMCENAGFKEQERREISDGNIWTS